MTKRSSGSRRARTSPHEKTDQPLLRRAIQLIATGQAQNPTDAFRQLVQDEDDVHIRRLQRRWRQRGDDLCNDFDTGRREQAWHQDLNALERNAPNIHARVTAFAQSPAGATLLQQIAGRPLPPMAFGIKRLWELIETTSPTGEAAADITFADALTHWSRFGTAPDRAFLLRFAELCASRADEMGEAEQ